VSLQLSQVEDTSISTKLDWNAYVAVLKGNLEHHREEDTEEQRSEYVNDADISPLSRTQPSMAS